MRISSSKIRPVYFLVLKADIQPTETEILSAIAYFVKNGYLEAPPDNALIAGFYDPDMRTDVVGGEFLVQFGNTVLDIYPELKQHISVSGNTFTKSDGIEMNIVGRESKIGYIRVVHVKEKMEGDIFENV